MAHREPLLAITMAGPRNKGIRPYILVGPPGFKAFSLLKEVRNHWRFEPRNVCPFSLHRYPNLNGNKPHGNLNCDIIGFNQKIQLAKRSWPDQTRWLMGLRRVSIQFHSVAISLYGPTEIHNCLATLNNNSVCTQICQKLFKMLLCFQKK